MEANADGVDRPDERVDEAMASDGAILDEELAKLAPSTSKKFKPETEDEARATSSRITRRSARMGMKMGSDGDEQPQTSQGSQQQQKEGKRISQIVHRDSDVKLSTLPTNSDMTIPEGNAETTRLARLKRRQKDISNEKEEQKKNSSPEEERMELGHLDNQRASMTHPLEMTQSQIKVGQQHQANLGDFENGTNANKITEEREDRDQALWIPPPELCPMSEESIEKYVDEAMQIHQMPADRALFILLKCSYNKEMAKEELGKRLLIVDEWSHDDRIVFQNAFNHYGKNFKIIQKALPHRPINSIISHYYDIKKFPESKLNPTKNDNDDERLDDFDDAEFGCCDNCGERPLKVLYTGHGKLCPSCFVYFTVMNKSRPIDGTSKATAKYRRALRCPAEMTEVVLEFEELALQCNPELTASKEETSTSAGCVIRSIESFVHEREKQIRTQIQRTRQEVIGANNLMSTLVTKNLVGGVDSYRLNVQREKQEAHDDETRGKRQRFDYRWNENEKRIAFHCIARYGLENLNTIAHIVQTKNADQVKAFFKENEGIIKNYLLTIEIEEENMAKAMNLNDELSANEIEELN